MRSALILISTLAGFIIIETSSSTPLFIALF
jgi:hypothetical protein